MYVCTCVVNIVVIGRLFCMEYSYLYVYTYFHFIYLFVFCSNVDTSRRGGRGAHTDTKRNPKQRRANLAYYAARAAEATASFSDSKAATRAIRTQLWKLSL